MRYDETLVNKLVPCSLIAVENRFLRLRGVYVCAPTRALYVSTERVFEHLTCEGLSDRVIN